jgi:hypothetical protein
MFSGVVFAQDWRAELGGDRARAIEHIVSVASPGSRIGWDGEVAVEFPGGRRKALRLPGFMQLPDSVGHLLISAVEYPEDAKEAVRLLKASVPVPAGTVQSLIVLARLTRANSVAGSRTVALDPDAVVSECRSIRIADQSADNGWPRLHVTYRSWYSYPDMIGSVDWVALVDETQRIVGRTPSAFWRKSRDGSETGDILRGTATAEGVELEGARTQFRRILQCATPCRVEPRAVLDEVR